MNISSIIVVLAAALVGCGYPSAAQDRPNVTVVVEGKSDWRIEPVSKELPVVKWVAGELQTYIRHISGCEFPIAVSRLGHPAIIIGKRKDLTAEDQAALPPSPKGYDGYAVAVRAARGEAPARIIIAGENDRGVIYGAYDLLEHFGCRWFYPAQDPHDPEVVPEQHSLVISAGDWAVASPFRFRICNSSSWIYEMEYQAAGKQLDWAMKNRYNCMAWGPENKSSLVAQYQRLKASGLLEELSKREMLLYGPGHCFDQLLKSEDYMGEHPEWFGMRNGKRVPQNFLGAQFCWSNPQARKQFAENAVAFAEACPEISILSLMPFDGGKCCDCPECRKAGSSNLLMVLMGETIDRLEQKHPELFVESLGGYGDVTTPPDNTKIHPKQRVIWAHWGRYHGTPYDDPRYDKTNLELWHQAAPGGLTVGQYYGDNFCEPWIMPPFALAIEGDRRYLVEKKINSVCVLLWPPGYWWNHGLNGYLAGRCFFDATLDPFQELREYVMRYFGSDAGPAMAA